MRHLFLHVCFHLDSMQSTAKTHHQALWCKNVERKGHADSTEGGRQWEKHVCMCAYTLCTAGSITVTGPIDVMNSWTTYIILPCCTSQDTFAMAHRKRKAPIQVVLLLHCWPPHSSSWWFILYDVQVHNTDLWIYLYICTSLSLCSFTSPLRPWSVVWTFFLRVFSVYHKCLCKSPV